MEDGDERRLLCALPLQRHCQRQVMPRRRPAPSLVAAQAVKVQFGLDANATARALRAEGYLGGMIATGVSSWPWPSITGRTRTASSTP